MDVMPLVGRILLVVLFVFSGAVKFVDPSGTAGHIAEQGLPAPLLLAYAAGALEVGAGLLIAVGWQTRWAAIALAVFAVVAALIFHDFWTFEGREQIDQMLHLLKNLSISGGLLCLAAFGPGRISVEGRARR